MRFRRSLGTITGILALAVAATACSSGSSTATETSGSTGADTVALRLGYFPNVTHAPAILGIESGSFAKDLGTKVKLSTSVFNAGPNAVTALLSGAIDAAFVGPNPAISAFTKGNGAAVVVSGVASGGAFLVVTPEINGPEDLKGKKLADPQLNGTQDIALRWYLKQHGYATDANGGGDVAVIPQENSQTLTAFQNGDIDGAWVPEPWATRLVNEGGGKILVDERDEWPNKQFVTTLLLVSKDFLAKHPDTVRALVQATSNAIDTLNADPAKAVPTVAAGITKAAGKPIKEALVSASFESVTYTVDPIASSLFAVASHAEQLGGKAADLDGIFDLSILNDLRAKQGKPEVASK